MAQVSKWKLSEAVEQRILHIFWRSWGRGVELGLKESVGEIFTETEKTVLSKRLAIAMMLVKGYGYSEIREFLHVSPPTIAKVSDWLEFKSGLRKVIERLVRESEQDMIWEQMKGILAEGGPDLLPGTNWSVRVRRKSLERDRRARKQEAVKKL